MPLHTSLISAGAGSTIPIAGGAATSGDIAQDTRFGPVNIGGLFGSPASSTGQGLILPIALAGVAIIAATIIFRRR